MVNSMNGCWLKVAKAAGYAGVSVRTIRTWLKDGLRYSRPRGGVILISTKALDEYLSRYEVSANRVDELVSETLAEFI